jgi:hypothetical protein
MMLGYEETDNHKNETLGEGVSKSSGSGLNSFIYYQLRVHTSAGTAALLILIFNRAKMNRSGR